ncbi:MAG TPA: ATP-binding protein, partial [Deltaproteobacteria bacterium]|nr:ATP-binding protein [Deltaproteobacteria bacterium]
ANLCTNAAHAMDKTGGTLEVSVRQVPADGVPEDVDAPAGPCVRLTVRDTGSGMTPQTMARIFDPYFTTRGKGTGTGLGLSVIHGIVKSHGGSIVCRSLPGEGTTFDIFLPLHEGTGERGEDGDARVLDLDRELSPGGGGQAGTRADGFRTGTP